MYSQYADNYLAQIIADEKLMFRERINLNVPHNPFVALKFNYNTIVTGLQKWLEKTETLPVYCFEYAPEC